MGQTLSEPVVDKHTTSDSDDRILWGASEMQGWRLSMEDAHTTILRLVEEKKVSFFAVYDGHGGANVAQYAGKHLHTRIAKEKEFEKGEYSAALKNGFLNFDVDIKQDLPSDPSGCTAVAALITEDNKVFVANAGDSRAVLSANGVAVPLSEDHKPTNPGETQRIVAAGGFVEFSRVNGNLALSRALGDFDFKTNQNLTAEAQIVTSNPEITERKLEPTDEFIVLACDGIWDCMSSQEVVDFVRQRIVLENGNIPLICEQLMDKCLAPDSEYGGVGCDNMTVVIVAFLWGKKKDDWVAELAPKVEFNTASDEKDEKGAEKVGESVGETTLSGVPEKKTPEKPPIDD
ncbi:Protein phosphatase 2C 2 [Nowakowskiella sp. JEL0407]|nr:Protein phosphatase 2C 2 [Nowakowskiella sp. JEL0407]